MLPIAIHADHNHIRKAIAQCYWGKSFRIFNTNDMVFVSDETVNDIL